MKQHFFRILYTAIAAAMIFALFSSAIPASGTAEESAYKRIYADDIAVSAGEWSLHDQAHGGAGPVADIIELYDPENKDPRAAFVLCSPSSNANNPKNEGSPISFRFTGVALKWYALTATTGSLAKIEIRDSEGCVVEEAVVDLYAPLGGPDYCESAYVYDSAANLGYLPPDTYTVTITNEGPNASLRTGYPDYDVHVESIWFDILETAPLTAALNVAAEPSDMGRVSVSAEGSGINKNIYENGETVTLTAMPENGCEFTGWYLNGEKISEKPVFTMTIEGDMLCTAGFKPETQPLQSPGEGAVQYDLGEGSYYATFQSHNQKIVSNKNGIFMSYFNAAGDDSHKEDTEYQRIFLKQSKDNGKTWSLVYSEVCQTRSPVLETDAEGNIYMAFSNWMKENNKAWLYVFFAEDNYMNPRKIELGSAFVGKFAGLYNPYDQHFWYAMHNGMIFIVDVSDIEKREVKPQKKTIRIGGKDGQDKNSRSYMQYPYFFVDEDNTVHFAWTTSDKYVDMHYNSIQYMRTNDLGETWYGMDGELVGKVKKISYNLTWLDIDFGENGESTRIVEENELCRSTWLSNMTVNDGKIHFIYRVKPGHISFDQAQGGALGIHYKRYDLETGVCDIDRLSPTFGGKKCKTNGDDGFFTLGEEVAPGMRALYFTGSGALYNGYWLSVVKSVDNGETWTDVAASQRPGGDMTYAVSGSRYLTEASENVSGGLIIGAYTARHIPGADTVYSLIYLTADTTLQAG